MKRNLFVLLSLLVIASVLTACGGAPATATEAPPVVTEPPTEAATEPPTEAATEAPATEAALNGVIDFMLHSFSGLLMMVEAGKLRAIAVTTDKR